MVQGSLALIYFALSLWFITITYVVTSILDKISNIQVVKAITGYKDTSTILDHYANTTLENVERGLEITRINTGLK